MLFAIKNSNENKMKYGRTISLKEQKNRDNPLKLWRRGWGRWFDQHFNGSIKTPLTKNLYFTIVNYNTIVKNYGNFIYYGKTKVLWEKLWYYTENYETSIYLENKSWYIVYYQKL